MFDNEYTTSSNADLATKLIRTAATEAVDDGMGLPYFVMLAIDAYTEVAGNNEDEMLDWDQLGHGVREAAAAAGITRLTE